MRNLFRFGRLKREDAQKRTTVEFDLFSSKFRQNPYPYYSELRERSPIHYFRNRQVWAISRYSDVIAVLKKPALFSSIPKNPGRISEMVKKDPPEHTQERKILSSFFSERSVAVLEESIQNLTNQLMDQIPTRGHCELMSDIAGRLPAMIIAEILGVDLTRCDDLRRWATDWFMETTNPSGRERFEKSMREFLTFSEEHVENSEKHMGKGLIGALLHPGPDQEKISAKDACDLVQFLVIAGTHTTTHLIGNAVFALLRNPDEMKLVKANPNLIPAVIEETLRFDPPVQMIQRTVLEDAEIGGVQVPAGATMKILIASANRDERQFPDPDRFWIHRSPQDHVAFGLGIHHCIAARLARLEARIVLETLLFRLSGLRPAQNLDSVEPIALRNFHLRGIKRLELAFDYK